MGIPVNFKRGSQASLDSMVSLNATTAQFKEGTFYLTDDTNRLYFAQADNKLVDLNQYIHIWANQSLPNLTTVPSLKAGDIYYLQDSNILAICNNPQLASSSDGWTQLNPDTYLTANEANISLTSPSSTTNTVVITSTVTDSKSNTSRGQFTLVGGSNVTLSRENNVITIASTDTNDNYTYGLATTTGTNQANLVLNAAGGGTTSSVTIHGGGSVEVTSNANGEITVSGSGGVSAIDHSINAAGDFITLLTTTDGTVTSNYGSSQIRPTITYGATNAPVTAVFASGNAELEVYTRAQVDNLISTAQASANAMMYKGTVSSSDANSKIVSTANVGDTYKASEDFTYNGLTVNAGDLVIAEGTDGNVTWSVVPSGDDQLITTSISGNTFTIADNIDQTMDQLGALTINGSTSNYGNIDVTSASSGTSLTLTVSHGSHGTGTPVTYATASGANIQELNTAVSIPTITGISLDSAGHVTSVTASTYTLTDTHATIDAVEITTAATNNIATVTVKVQDTDGQNDQDIFRIKSNNLEITSASADSAYNINVDFVWGSF